MASTTSAAATLSNEQRLVSLEAKLAIAEAKLQKWSDLVERAILGGKKHKGKLETYEKERDFWVKEREVILQQIAAGKYYSFLNQPQRTDISSLI